MKKTFDYKWFWTSVIAFLFPSIFGFILYALPKYLIKKYLLKKYIRDFEIAKDVAISGFIIGIISSFGKGVELGYLSPEISGGASTFLTILAYFGIYLILLILQVVFRFVYKIFKKDFDNEKLPPTNDSEFISGFYKYLSLKKRKGLLNNLIKMIKSNYLIILGLTIMIFLSYWFIFRETYIKKNCYKESLPSNDYFEERYKDCLLKNGLDYFE